MWFMVRDRFLITDYKHVTFNISKLSNCSSLVDAIYVLTTQIQCTRLLYLLRSVYINSIPNYLSKHARHMIQPPFYVTQHTFFINCSSSYCHPKHRCLFIHFFVQDTSTIYVICISPLQFALNLCIYRLS